MKKNLRLKVARTELDLTQQDLADAVGVSRQTINGLEKGSYAPSLNLCIQICNVLEKTLDDIFWQEGEIIMTKKQQELLNVLKQKPFFTFYETPNYPYMTTKQNLETHSYSSGILAITEFNEQEINFYEMKLVSRRKMPSALKTIPYSDIANVSLSVAKKYISYLNTRTQVLLWHTRKERKIPIIYYLIIKITLNDGEIFEMKSELWDASKDIINYLQNKELKIDDYYDLQTIISKQDLDTLYDYFDDNLPKDLPNAHTK